MNLKKSIFLFVFKKPSDLFGKFLNLESDTNARFCCLQQTFTLIISAFDKDDKDLTGKSKDTACLGMSPVHR